MRIKDGYIIRNIADAYIVVPTGERVIEFKGMMTTNKSGAFIWEKLQSDRTYEELLEAVIGRYDIDRETAAADLNEFLDTARDSGVLEE